MNPETAVTFTRGHFNQVVFAVHETPWDTMRHTMRHHETLWDTPWDTMRHHETPWYITRHHNTSRDAMRHHETHHETSRDTMRHHETSRDTMRHHKTPWSCHIFCKRLAVMLSEKRDSHTAKWWGEFVATWARPAKNFYIMSIRAYESYNETPWDTMRQIIKHQRHHETHHETLRDTMRHTIRHHETWLDTTSREVLCCVSWCLMRFW